MCAALPFFLKNRYICKENVNVVDRQVVLQDFDITSVEMRPSFMPTIPYSSDSATRQPRAMFSVKAYAANPAQSQLTNGSMPIYHVTSITILIFVYQIEASVPTRFDDAIWDSEA